jgi:hypothetical protein
MMKKILVGLTALSLLALVAGPALAYGHRSSSDINIENENDADIDNTVITIANTGDNTASGGNGGNGGNVVGGGEGGNGGDGVGGYIDTGNANADATVINVANTNYTRVKAPCSRCSGEIEVENDDNDADVDNKVVTKAETGDNTASEGDGGNGGSVTQQQQSCHHRCGCQNPPSQCPCPEGGDGGNGEGGYILTGDADSSAKVITVVNTNITRVRRSR